MSDESNQQAAKRVETKLSDEADRMEARLEELDEHVEEARNKADDLRGEGSPDDIEVPVGDEDTEDTVPEPAQEP